MAIQIRTMQKSDFAGAIALWRSLPGLGLSGADEEEQIHLFLTKNPETCFVAEENDTIIGTVLGGNDSRRGYIYHLAVKKAHQRSGLGRKLVERCLDALKAEGLQKCHIFVISGNQEGIRFWERVGWTKRGDLLIMSMDI